MGGLKIKNKYPNIDYQYLIAYFLTFLSFIGQQ